MNRRDFLKSGGILAALGALVGLAGPLVAEPKAGELPERPGAMRKGDDPGLCYPSGTAWMADSYLAVTGSVPTFLVAEDGTLLPDEFNDQVRND